MRNLIGDATPELGHLPENEVSRGPSVEAQIFGDLKLFEPKTKCPLITVRDREER